MGNHDEYIRAAEVVRVIDGDTFTASVDLGLQVFTVVRFRLRGIDTPETRTRDAAEKAHGLAAKQAVERLILGRTVTIRSHKGKKTFDRWLADVWFTDPQTNEVHDLAEWLRKNGFEKKKNS